MAVLSRTFGRTEQRAASLRVQPILLVTGIAVIVVALLTVVQNSDAATTNVAIQELERQKLTLQTQAHQLEAEVAALSSLSRIEQEALVRLGLVPPEERQAVAVNVGWDAASQPPLPTRFAPATQAEDERGSSWWRDLLEILPFN